MTFESKYLITQQANSEFVLPELGVEAGCYNDGLIQLVDKEYSLNIDLTNWYLLCNLKNEFQPICFTGFGFLFLYYALSDSVWFLNTDDCSLTNIGIKPKEFLNGFLVFPSVVENTLAAPMFEQVCRKKSQTLNFGQCFILKPYIFLGGEETPENYSVGDFSIYLDLVAQTHLSILNQQ